VTAADRGLVTPAEAARLAGVTPATVRRWAATGALPSYVTAGGHRRYRVVDVTRAAAVQGRQART
jgi:excisionase family DNA binding protein